LGDPVSLVAAEIHHGPGPTDIAAAGLENPSFKTCANARWTKKFVFSVSYLFCIALTGSSFMPFEKAKA
jgi:hypothetical protein